MENSSNNKLDSEDFKPDENLNNNNNNNPYVEKYRRFYQQSSQNQFEGAPTQSNRNPSYEAPYPNNDQQTPRTFQTGYEPYQNYFGPNNSKVWQNDNFGINQFKKMRSVSIAAINTFIIWFILAIVLAALSIAISTINKHSFTESLIAYLQQPPSSSGSYPSSPPSTGGTSTVSAVNTVKTLYALDTTLVYFEAIFGIFWGLFVLICGIVGAVRALELSKKSDFFIVIMVLYIVGIFVPPFQVMAAFISLSKVKEYAIFINNQLNF